MGKQRVIDTLYFRGIGEIKVLYDVDKTVFKAKVFNEWMSDKHFEVLKTMVADEVKRVALAMYEWIPVIEVEEVRDRGDDDKCMVVSMAGNGGK